MNLKNRFLYEILNYWSKQTTEKGSLWFNDNNPKFNVEFKSFYRIQFALDVLNIFNF